MFSIMMDGNIERLDLKDKNGFRTTKCMSIK
jgi:hypothetical protein